MMAEDLDEELMVICYRRVRAAQKDLEKLERRSREISESKFNPNIFSEEECYRLFRFRPKDIGKIVDICGWSGGRTNGQVKF